ncbi:LacI family DNA-binding transcriptional regulator [Niabella terrae]
MKAKKDITIYDIADKVGMSSATVSRALQNHKGISAKTKKKVAEAARQMGYRLNKSASSLRSKKTYTIGVLVHELNSNFITSVLAGIEKITTEAGYDIIIAHSGESMTKEKANAANLFSKRVDGLMASLAFDTDNLDHFEAYLDNDIPVVFFDRAEESNATTKVIIDNQRCGYEATRHLIDQGCKRIAMVTASLKRNVYALRHKGYMAALQEAGIKYQKQLVFVTDLGEQASEQTARAILKMHPRPDGVFVTNDFAAAVCMHTFKDHGLEVPRDIAIVGFNNDPISKIVQPTLSTIDYPGMDMGAIAAQNLINHLKGVSDLNNTNTIIVKSELITRQSSLKATAGARKVKAQDS